MQQDWLKPIHARVNGTVDNLYAAETAAIKRLYDEYRAREDARPTLDATVMTPGQLAVLTRCAHMHGRASEMTREILAAFGLAWGWPVELPEVERRFESQQVLVSARPVPVAAPPAPPAPPAVPVPVPPTPETVNPVTLAAAAPNPPPVPTLSGFVELPQATEPTPTPTPTPTAPPQEPPPKPPHTPGRATFSATVVKTDD